MGVVRIVGGGTVIKEGEREEIIIWCNCKENLIEIKRENARLSSSTALMMQWKVNKLCWEGG